MLWQVLNSGQKKQEGMWFCINSCCHAEMLISVKQALSALPPHEITGEIFEGQQPHRCFHRIKSQRIPFNRLGQKGLYLISPTTNSIAVAAISFAHLEELNTWRLPICAQVPLCWFHKMYLKQVQLLLLHHKHPSGPEINSQRRVEIKLHSLASWRKGGRQKKARPYMWDVF